MQFEIKEKEITPLKPLTKKEKELLDSVEVYEDELVKLLQDLVKINSLNPSEKEFVDRSAIFEFVETYMKQAGMKNEFFQVPFDSGKENEFYYNLLSSFGDQTAERVLQFNGHLDIVPFNVENWDKETFPLSGKIKDGKFTKNILDTLLYITVEFQV